MRAIIISVVVATLSLVGPLRAEEVVLRIDNVHSEEDAEVVIKALSKVDSVKSVRVTSKEEKSRHLNVSFDLAKVDLGDFARAVAAVKNPGRNLSPLLVSLAMVYRRLDASAAPDTQVVLPITREAFPKLAGVDARKCRVDLINDFLFIKLDDNGGAKLDQIKKGFPGLLLQNP